MRWAGVSIFALAVAAASCAGRKTTVVNAANSSASPEVAGIWDGVVRATISEGMGTGDTRIEKQEWHLAQSGGSISGYYIAALTFVSGDGRPYVCSRQPQFSAVQRYDVSGSVRNTSDGGIEIQEIAQKSSEGRCDPGNRRLFHYEGKVQGDVLTLVVNGQQKQTLYRSRGADERGPATEASAPSTNAATSSESPFPSLGDGPKPPSAGGSPADVSGLWIWEHQGTAPGGDEKQEREEWHVTQEGAKLTGYYDRVVRRISVDGHAYRCSMSLEFEIATRYRINGEVRGNQVIIYENSFEILEPNACDNGKRRLDAYEGQASTEELRLVWGVGGQVLHRPHPDVPTQRF